MLTTFFLLSFVFLVGRPKTAPTPPQAPVYEFRPLGVFLFGPLAKTQAPTIEAPEGGLEVAFELTALIRLAALRLRLFMLDSWAFNLDPFYPFFTGAGSQFGYSDRWAYGRAE